MPLQSPKYNDKTQKIQEMILEISLSSLQPMDPSQAKQPTVTPNTQPLSTVAHQNDFRDKDINFAIKMSVRYPNRRRLHRRRHLGALSRTKRPSQTTIPRTPWSPTSQTPKIWLRRPISSRQMHSTLQGHTQHEAVGSLYSTIGLMGQLAVLEFCNGKQVRLPVSRIFFHCSSMLILTDAERLQFLHPRSKWFTRKLDRSTGTPDGL